jgi:DNA-binding CsgD family transcriptional regulator
MRLPMDIDGRAPRTPVDDASNRGEVGRISLGESRFAVVLASARSQHPYSEEVCCFEVDGLQLLVLSDQQKAKARVDDLAARLTGRELQIAVLVAQGYATKNIAFRLQISEWTVTTYLRRVFAKLNVDSRAAMVYRCASLIDETLTTTLFHDRSVRSERAEANRRGDA